MATSLLPRLLLAVTATTLVCLTVVPPAAGAPRDRAAEARPGADRRPLVIGHRGASGYRPEHTLASYELAARMGADYIEPDLVATADGVLVARHENEISTTTDVAERAEFADRETTKSIDGHEVTGWFTEDFTLAELKTLRAKERLPRLRPDNTRYDGRYEVPTFQEVIDLTQRLSRELGRDIGIYPETKHPSYFSSIGLPLEPPLVRTLTRNGLNHKNAKVFVQSFEVSNLKALDKALRVPLVQLVWKDGQPYDFTEAGDERTYADMVTPEGLAEIGTYADGVGPEKTMVITWNDDGSLGAATDLVPDAHDAGLVVHPYTFRAENAFLPTDYRSSDDPAEHGEVIGELGAYYDLGVDGVFTDFPDLGVAARDD
ncbi:glycerophosphodiester phosphodiesterase [Haloechinothrix salitolerans]|uniref:glycerophosphodiester phosphodiesterase n=1 Tax=Haloechinothrix salitolerans TaxID=926830 RepID=A0ABW2C0Y6_9PSEU